MLSTVFYFLCTSSANYLLMHLDYLVATHSRRCKDEEIEKIFSSQRGGGATCSLPDVVAVLVISYYFKY